MNRLRHRNSYRPQTWGRESMKRKREFGAKGGLSVVFLLLFFAVGSVMAEVTDRQPENATGTSDMNEKVAILDIAAKLNIFRLSAGFDVDRALEVWASTAFRQKWEQEVAVGFKDPSTQNQLRDFFSSAVEMIGRYQDGKAVVLFYNPWADGLLLIAVSPGSERPVLEDFQFIAGESWRKETPQSAEDFLALYTAKEPLLTHLARKYAAVEERFNQDYPAIAPFAFLPPSVAADAGPNGDEIKPLVIRLAYRQHMFSVLLSKQNAEAVGVVRDLRVLFAAPYFNELAAYLAPSQNVEMLQSVSQMPSALLANMSPNYFAKAADGKSSLVGLVNAESPRWFLAVRIAPGIVAEKPDVTLEAFDLGVSSKIVQ